MIESGSEFQRKYYGIIYNMRCHSVLSQQTSLQTFINGNCYYGFVVGVGMQLMKSFSLYETVPKMMDSSPKPNQLQGLDGIRFLSMSWVILGHVYAFPMYYGVRKFSQAMTYFIILLVFSYSSKPIRLFLNN